VDSIVKWDQSLLENKSCGIWACLGRL